MFLTPELCDLLDMPADLAKAFPNLIHVTQELIQDMTLLKKPKYIKPITNEEIAEWKEGEKLLNSINIEEAKKRVKLERDPRECPPYMAYEEWDACETWKLDIIY